MITEKGVLVAKKSGIYTNYVFQIATDSFDKYIMCTKPPNWDVPDIKIGDVGFFTYKIVEAGESYFNPKNNEIEKYNYTNVYFINFIEECEPKKNEKILII